MCECCTPKNTIAPEANLSVRAVAESDCGCGCGGGCGCGDSAAAQDREPKRQPAQVEQPAATLESVAG